MAQTTELIDNIETEDRFRLIIEATPTGIVMVDSKRVINLINQQIVNMFGYSEDELIGKSIEILVPEETRAHHPELVHSFFANPTPRAMGEGRELFGLKKDGKKIPVEIGLRPLKIGNEIFVIGIIVDITKRFLSEQIIKQKTEELEQFAYRTSHDLRSPLVTLGGLLDCVQEDIDGQDYNEAKENIKRSKSLISKLQSLVQDILNLTRADYLPEVKVEIDFNKIIATTNEKLAYEISNANIDIKANLSHIRPLVTENTRIAQILDNLISNSIKYRNPKKNSYVLIKTENNDDHFLIHIEDNGLGIPENRQSEVFGMFKRFHEGSIAGSGLGLYIVKKHLLKLNAKVEFKSSNDGTTFMISIPFIS